MLKLEHVGVDGWSRPVYRDQHGQFWKDVNLGRDDNFDLYSADTFDGEPGWHITEEWQPA